MYKRMLVPLDGSELSEIVLSYVKELANRLQLEVTLFHVCNPKEDEMTPLREAYIEHKAEIFMRQLKSGQEKKNIKPEGKKVQVKGEFAIGSPAEEILHYAEKNNIDLILMTTHGRSGFKRWLLGSVADKVLSSSKLPVWLVPARVAEEIIYDKWPKRTILVPLDGSKLAESVLPHVIALTKQWEPEPADVVLFGVCEPLAAEGTYFLNIPLIMEELENYLTKTEKQLKDAGFSVRVEIRRGKPAEKIVDFVNENSINLIIMSTHARSGLGRWSFGSVTAKVLRDSTRPIFLVRPQ